MDALITAMKQNRLGTSDIWVSEIGFGCMSLGTDENAGIDLLHTALDLGVTFFDTADLYDQGQNEFIVGKALKDQRDKVVIASKVGNRWNNDGKSWHWDASAKWIKEAIHHSLERLQIDYLDLYQLHGGTIDDPLDDVIEAFEDLKREGLIRAYGTSSIRPNVIREWLQRSQFDSNMMQYSLLDRRPEESALDLLKDARVSVIARGPVAKGLLSNKTPRAYLDYSKEEIENLQAALDTFVLPDRSKGQLALRYALAHPAVSTVMPGASNLEQLRENVAASQSLNLSEAELEQLRTLSKASVYLNHR